MRIITINCGSSSVKARLYAAGGDELDEIARASVQQIGDAPVLRAFVDGTERAPQHLDAGDYAGAIAAIVETFGDCRRVAAVGHRVVYGGSYRDAVIIDSNVMDAIERGAGLAPLHNAPALRGILAASAQMPGVLMAAVFDTQFHATIPPVAAEYALPRAEAARHGLRRIGYHGLAHQSIMERFAEAIGRPASGLNLITLQLGNGCSATAIAGGVSVDTSMGFTPLEGLMMATRPGDIDPGALVFMMRAEGLNADALDDMLNHRSGLHGVSGVSGDVRTVLEAERMGDVRAHLAIEMFCYRIRKYIGAYLAVLGRVDAVLFGGGIGEHQPEIRRRVCDPLRPLGLRLDGDRNTRVNGGAAGVISDDASPIAVWVVPTDEERIIARETHRLVRAAGSGGSDG